VSQASRGFTNNSQSSMCNALRALERSYAAEMTCTICHYPL